MGEGYRCHDTLSSPMTTPSLKKEKRGDKGLECLKIEEVAVTYVRCTLSCLYHSRYLLEND